VVTEYSEEIPQRPIHTLSHSGKALAISLTVLRITTRHTALETTFVVEGKLAGRCVGELEKCWLAAANESRTSILIDLSSVTFIDTSGKELLALIYKTGARFVTAGLIAKSVVEEIQGAEP